MVLLKRGDKMNILFIGDIFGEEGLSFLENNIKKIKEEYKVNLIIANAENTSYGKGLHFTHYKRLMQMGINMLTMGNHTFSNVDIRNFIDKSNIVRPANIPTTMGYGYRILKYNYKAICVVNLMGRTFQNSALDCPFKTMDRILNKVEADYFIVDFHGEATSEKIAFGFDFDGKVDAVLGTHTHVPTADERILPKGTLYISDVGMTGPRDGVIGNEKDKIISRFRTGVYEPAGVEKGRMQINAVLLELGNKKSIKRIHIEN